MPHNKVDKFIDVLLTKGPKGIGVFHEALGKTYPGLFDYLTRLFTSKGIDLPESRRSMFRMYYYCAMKTKFLWYLSYKIW